MRVHQEGILVPVAVRDGEGAEDEEDVEKQFEEDTLGEFLLLPTFPGCLQDAVWDRVRGQSRGVCNQSVSQWLEPRGLQSVSQIDSQPWSLDSRGVLNQSVSQPMARAKGSAISQSVSHAVSRAEGSAISQSVSQSAMIVFIATREKYHVFRFRIFVLEAKP